MTAETSRYTEALDLIMRECVCADLEIKPIHFTIPGNENAGQVGFAILFNGKVIHYSVTEFWDRDSVEWARGVAAKGLLMPMIAWGVNNMTKVTGGDPIEVKGLIL